jgi:type I restriction enzyme S subunit
LLEAGSYPVLRVGNFFTNKNWYYSDLELDENKYCDDGDLLYAWSASFGPRIWKGGKVIYHYHIWKVLPSDQVDRDYLYYFFDWDKELIKKEQGAGFANSRTRISVIPGHAFR